MTRLEALNLIRSYELIIDLFIQLGNYISKLFRRLQIHYQSFIIALNSAYQVIQNISEDTTIYSLILCSRFSWGLRKVSHTHTHSTHAQTHSYTYIDIHRRIHTQIKGVDHQGLKKCLLAVTKILSSIRVGLNQSGFMFVYFFFTLRFEISIYQSGLQYVLEVSNSPRLILSLFLRHFNRFFPTLILRPMRDSLKLISARRLFRKRNAYPKWK